MENIKQKDTFFPLCGWFQ